MPLQHQSQVSILDQGGHNQKLSKIETLRLAQNYIQLLSFSVASNRKFQYEDIHHMLTRNLSQSTGNLLRARLIYDLDYSIAKNLIDDGSVPVPGGEAEDDDEKDNCQACYLDPYWNQDGDPENYSDYFEVNSCYNCCYK